MKAALLESPPLDGYGQMALDEALLDACGKENAMLRFYRWSAPAATFGYFQRYAEVGPGVFGRLGENCALVRRMTGGGVVYHDGDVTFSFIFPWGALTGASRIYEEVHRGIHLGLKSRGLISRLWSPRQVPSTPQLSCFSGPSPMDLVHEDGSKFLGGALRRRNGIGLYQGSLRREGFNASGETLESAIQEGIGLAWDLRFETEPVGEPRLRTARLLADEKYRTHGWLKRR